MAEPIDPIALASALINCPSVTPASGKVFDVLEQALMRALKDTLDPKRLMNPGKVL